MKLKVNNKPLQKEQKDKAKQQKDLKEKYGEVDLPSVFKYIESLEKRITKLESKNLI